MTIYKGIEALLQVPEWGHHIQTCFIALKKVTVPLQ